MDHENERIRLFIAEEQQLLLGAYCPMAGTSTGLEIVGTSPRTDPEALAEAVSLHHPDVMIIGTGVLTPRVVEDIRSLKEVASGIALVVLSFSYERPAVRLLSQLSAQGGARCSFLLKQTLATAEQIGRVVTATWEGRVVIDPVVMGELFEVDQPQEGPLTRLTPREQEVLKWMAQGYRNAAIATILYLEPKTVERHINNIYAKLDECPGTKHPRIQAITLLLAQSTHLSSEYRHDETEALAERDLAEAARDRLATRHRVLEQARGR